MSKNKYNHIIIGSGIEAFLKALELQSQGLHGCIIEKEELPGGLYRGIKTDDFLFESHLNFLAFNESVIQVLETLKTLLPDFSYQTIDLGPITFHNGQPQPFVGFGSTENEAVDLYSEFTQSTQVLLSHNVSYVIDRLKAQYNGDILTLNEVTDLELNPEVFVVLNGSTKISAEEIYFFDSPLKLSNLLTNSNSVLPKALVQKMAKTTLWTTVNLIYKHKQSVTESKAIHVLYGAKEQPSIGRFQSENGLPTSQWLCFLSSEVAADSEQLGSTIREMKKQIKRMYPAFFETVVKESILIAPDSYGRVNPQLLENNRFPKLDGIKVGSRFYASMSGLAGDFLTATPSGSATNDFDVNSPTSEASLT